MNRGGGVGSRAVAFNSMYLWGATGGERKLKFRLGKAEKVKKNNFRAARLKKEKERYRVFRMGEETGKLACGQPYQREENLVLREG